MQRLTEIIKFNGKWALNDTPIRLKCPRCITDSKNPRQVKIYKTVRGLIRHISLDHKGEFWVDDCKFILKNVSIALESGVIVNA